MKRTGLAVTAFCNWFKWYMTNYEYFKTLFFFFPNRREKKKSQKKIQLQQKTANLEPTHYQYHIQTKTVAQLWIRLDKHTVRYNPCPQKKHAHYTNMKNKKCYQLLSKSRSTRKLDDSPKVTQDICVRARNCIPSAETSSPPILLASRVLPDEKSYFQSLIFIFLIGPLQRALLWWLLSTKTAQHPTPNRRWHRVCLDRGSRWLLKLCFPSSSSSFKVIFC